jgi:hypothetical protein
MATADFTIADVLAWARTKPADEAYNYNCNGRCAIGQFLSATGRASDPNVGNATWDDLDNLDRCEGVPFPPELDWAAECLPNTFGAFVERLEVLSLETVVTRSEWTRLDAYLTDIEAVAEKSA